MNLRHLSGRVAAAGAVTALAAGTLVGIATTAAQAADPAGVGYNCVTPLSPNPIPVIVGATGFPSELTAGEAVPAGAVPLSFTLTRAVLDGMASSGIHQVGISTTNFKLGVGSTSVGMTGVDVAKTAAPTTGDLVLTAASKNAAFTAPAAGTYDLTAPTTFAAHVDNDLFPLDVTCTIANAATAKIGSVTTTGDTVPAPVMQSSTTKATAPAKITKGKSLKVSVTVTTEAAATGTVTAKEKSKTLGSATLKNGKATITVKGLKPGKHTISVSYSGDDGTNASVAKTVKVKVVKKK